MLMAHNKPALKRADNPEAAGCCIFEPVAPELREKQYMKIVSPAPEVV